MLLWVVVLTTVIHFSKVVMTTFCAGYRVFRILYVALLKALCGSHISLPTFCFFIGSLSVNLLISMFCLLIFKCLQTCLSPYFHSGLTPYSCIQNTRRTSPCNHYLTTVSFVRKVHKSKLFLIIVSLWVLLGLGTPFNVCFGVWFLSFTKGLPLWHCLSKASLVSIIAVLLGLLLPNSRCQQPRKICKN